MKKTQLLLFFILVMLSGCKAVKTPKYKKYVMNEKFITVKGIHIPELTPDRKTFNPPAQLVRDMENSLEMGRTSEVYPDSKNAYREAAKHHLIKVTAVNVRSYSYDDIKYDETYNKLHDKYEIISYNYTEDNVLEYVTEKKKQIIPFNKNLSIGSIANPEYADEAILEYDCTFHYYPNGQLKQYGSSIANAYAGSQFIDFGSMMIGSEYEYDESGNLMKSVNHEEGFTMDFPGILKFALENISTLKEKYKTDIYRVSILHISRNKNTLGSFWIIPYKLAYHRLLFQIIDDSTGQVIDEFEKNEMEKLQKYINKPVE